MFRWKRRDKRQPLIDQINGLSALEKVTLWRALGEQLLVAGNSFEDMIAGMPAIETAIYCLIADALTKPSPTE